MHAALKRLPALALALGASAYLTLTGVAFGGSPPPGPGDYPVDAAPSVDALAHGHLGTFLEAHPVMGPFSILLRAPIAAVAGTGQLAAYRWGALACVLAAGFLGLYLARLAARRGAAVPTQLLVVLLCVANPLTLNAIAAGHPEEVLTAALCVGAVAVASEGHACRAALLLGLALATKQWALIAVLPTLMALPGRRVPVALGAAGVALLLMLPGFVVDSHGFFAAQQNAAATRSFIDSWSAWYPFAGSIPGVVATGPEGVALASPAHGGSALIGQIAHPLIVLTALGVPILLALRRRRFRCSGAEAMTLLALIALLRCALDPVDNLYYHEPLLLSLLGLDALSGRGLPLRSLAAVAIALLFERWSPVLDPAAFNVIYLAVMVPAGIALALSLSRRPHAAPRSAPIEVSGPKTAGAT